MRNGNSYRRKRAFLFFSVLILPMRNGNKIFTLFLLLTYFVLILPMRNGNYTTSPFASNVSNSSYPTYEEWKLIINNVNFFTCFCVLILPMRNGNQIH